MADTNGVIVSPTNDPMNLNNKSISNITALIGSANSARIDMTGVTPAIYDDSGIASIKFGSGMWGRNLCDFSGRNVLNWGYSAGSPISVFTNIYMDGGVVIGNLSGNANNSLNLGGIPAANFITAGTGPTFGSLILTNLPTSTNGLSVGAIYRSGSNLFIHGY